MVLHSLIAGSFRSNTTPSPPLGHATADDIFLQTQNVFTFRLHRDWILNSDNVPVDAAHFRDYLDTAYASSFDCNTRTSRWGHRDPSLTGKLYALWPPTALQLQNCITEDLRLLGYLPSAVRDFAVKRVPASSAASRACITLPLHPNEASIFPPFGAPG